MKILFYLFSHIRSFQGLFYHYELNANGFYLLLYSKISRDIYQKVCFGNNTYSGILTDFYHSFFLGGGGCTDYEQHAIEVPMLSTRIL